MSFKKLSLAAAISIGIFACSNAAQCQVGATPTATAPAMTEAPANVSNAAPTGYGAGPAGSFRAYGTSPSSLGNAAGATEISTFRSPTNQPTGSTAAMAAQGIYGQCAPCQPSTGCPVAPSATGGAAGIEAPPSSQVTIQESVATPQTSELTGGAAAAQQEGMKCVNPPSKPAPSVSIPCPTAMPAAPATGGAAELVPATPVMPSETMTEPALPTESVTPAQPENLQVSPGATAVPEATTLPETPAMPQATTLPATPLVPAPTGSAAGACPITPPACVPGTSTGSRGAVAPKGFDQPRNPGAIAPDASPGCHAKECPTGGAATALPLAPAQLCPCPPACPSTCPTTGGAATILPVAPIQPCPSACPTTGGASMVMPAQPMSSCPVSQCPSASAQAAIPAANIGMMQNQTIPLGNVSSCPSQVSGPISATYPGTPGNTAYIERQVYAYPSMSGVNATVPGSGSAISFGGLSNGVSVTSAQTNMATQPGAIGTLTNAFNQSPFAGGTAGGGYMGGAAPINSDITSAPVGYMTGGASPLGCPTVTELRTGAPVIISPAQVSTGPISILTPSGIQFQRMVLAPIQIPTGAAAPAGGQFSDVPSNFWAAGPIGRLASSGIIAGYPDRTFRPNLSVSRAEFASMLVPGLNLQNTPTIPGQLFRDVPANYWASNSIDKVYNKGLIAGYPNDTFRPNESISRAEALTTIARALPQTNMTATEADQILNTYSDANMVPNWARIPVANAVKAGLLQSSPAPNQIAPNQNASRADIAAMISQLRQELALEPAVAPAATGAAAAIQQQTVTIPVLNVKFNDRISARASHIGDSFTATTLEPITVNNVLFPKGSNVVGNIVEVIRPSGSDPGALKLSFNDVTYGVQTATLPKQVVTAQVQAPGTTWRDYLAQIATFPFVYPGRLVGTVGRTVGGATVVAGNASEQVLNDLGLASADLVEGQFGAAGRSAINSGVQLVRAPFEVARVALNGATGILNLTADEIGYVLDRNGARIVNITPSDTVAIAFGCQ